MFHHQPRAAARGPSPPARHYPTGCRQAGGAVPALLAALLTAGPAAAHPQTPPRAQPGTPVPSLPWYGDYLEDNYLAQLRATLSPAAAAQADHAAGIAQMLSVAPQRDGRRLVLTYDFQRMQAVLLLQPNGVARRELAWGAVPDMALRLVNPTTLCLTAQHGGEHCYHRAGNGPAAITRLALAGTYAGPQGATYRFNTDGTGFVPDGNITYALLLDEIRQGDLLQIGAGGPIMAYRHLAGALTLYPVRQSRFTPYGKPDYSQALATLRHTSIALASAGR